MVCATAKDAPVLAINLIRVATMKYAVKGEDMVDKSKLGVEGLSSDYKGGQNRSGFKGMLMTIPGKLWCAGSIRVLDRQKRGQQKRADAPTPFDQASRHGRSSSTITMRNARWQP